MSKAMIQLDHIDVTFQQKKRQIQAVKDVTIHINEGDIYGIVGYSGAGKSTLVRVINLLQVPWLLRLWDYLILITQKLQVRFYITI